MKKITLVVLTVFVSVNVFSQTVKPFPSVTVSNLKGEKIDAAKLAAEGKITVFNFWATWCVPCKRELNNMSELYDEWKKDYNVEIIAVSIDDTKSQAKVKSTVDGSGWDYTVLLDANQDLKRALNFQNIPYTVVVDSKGNIVHVHDGYVDGDEFLLEDKIKELAGK